MAAMARYIDGFVLPIPVKNIDAYREVATMASAVWLEHGAIDYFECISDDPAGEHFTPFPELFGAKDDEAVIFAWATFESKEARDAANAKIMQDERLGAMMSRDKPLFDMKRMAYGGFRELVGRTRQSAADSSDANSTPA